jgi:Virulence activator alpha C-term
VLGDPALLKLFFGADARELATAQLETHRQKLAEYETLAEADTGDTRRGPWQALELRTRHERETVNFWAERAQAGRSEP